jgi:hypothetical protein
MFRRVAPGGTQVVVELARSFERVVVPHVRDDLEVRVRQSRGQSTHGLHRHSLIFLPSDHDRGLADIRELFRHVPVEDAIRVLDAGEENFATAVPFRSVHIRSATTSGFSRLVLAEMERWIM